jgi:hypothetical protein
MTEQSERAEWAGEQDDELVALADERQDLSPLRPILMILVLILGSYIIHDWRDELSYFMSTDQPVVLGAVTDFPDRAQSGAPVVIPHNTYVSLEGIPSKRSISPKAQFFKLIGGEVYIETARADAHLTPLEREAQGAPKADTDRPYFRGEGRALDLARAPKRYQGLRKHYRERHGTVFCVDLLPGQAEERERAMREQLKQGWRETWASSSEAQRADLLMSTPEIPDERLEEIMADSPACVHAFLIQDGISPKKNWWYAMFAALFATFMLIDLVFLIGWIKRFLTPSDV